MALTVNTNVSALNAQRATLQSQGEMASAMERLATGKRINSAVDDAAGLAIAAGWSPKCRDSTRRSGMLMMRFPWCRLRKVLTRDHRYPPTDS